MRGIIIKGSICSIALLQLSMMLLAQQNLNSTRSWAPQKPIATEAELISTARTAEEVASNVQYADGFGRPVQTISRQSSPLRKDLVDMHVYDSWGREVRRYMSFISNVTTAGDITDDGNYKTTATQQQLAFNQQMYPGESNYYYADLTMENSPGNRVLNTYPPGINWVGGGRGTSMQNLVNTATDNVRIWSTLHNVAGIIPTGANAYAAGQLFKMLHTDEKGTQTIEFKDKDGNVVLKKVQQAAVADNGSGSGHAGWLCTYYVYDDYGNMRFVITPRVVELIDGSWVISSTMANELCFRYEYDQRNRATIKKTPGAGEFWYVYDKRGRMAMSQDANLRAIQKWQYFSYDNLDRPLTTGLITDPVNFNNLSFHQTGAASATGNYPNPASYTNELLAQTYYDNYGWTGGTGIGSALDATHTSNTAYFHAPSNTSFPYPQPITQTTMIRGMVTGSKTQVLGTVGSQYLYTANFYDDKGRTIQTQATNITGSVEKTTTQYSWKGLSLRVFEQHAKSGANAQTHTVLTKMNYDFAGRLLNVKKTISSVIGATTINSPEKTLAVYAYNELGQLKTKAIGTHATLGTPLENQTFDYHVRGWLTGINRGYTSAASTTGYFGMEIVYDKTSSSTGVTILTPAYTGNAGGVVWKSKSDAVPRKYEFTYDKANQLKTAAYLQNTSGSVWDKTYMDFSVNNINYDANGNITALSQNGFILGGTQSLDNLAYTYSASGISNRLQNVIDGANNATSKLGDFHYSGTKTTASVDYSYDANGNKNSDVNKNISSIVYNLLNMPATTTVSGKGVITNTYDAGGNKLKKQVLETNAVVPFNGTNYTTNITTITTYIGNFVYLSKTFSHAALATLNVTESLQYMLHEEGRARIVFPLYGQPAYFAFDYLLKDHQGNVRVTLTDELQQDTYPAATLEAGGIGTEQSFYNIVNDANHVIPTSSLPWYASATGSSYQNSNGLPVPPDPTISPTATSSKLYKLNGATGDRFGMGIALKVMAGDNISIFAKSVWHNNGAGTNNTGYNISGVLSTFVNAFAGTGTVIGGSKGTANGTILNGNSATTSGLTSVLGSVPVPAGQTPKAYINWILFDEQFKPVSSGSSFDPINTVADAVKTHSRTGISVPKSGYLYVYCSNESNQDVYFDNLQVVHNRGPLVEEKHFYPQGLAMFALNSRAYNKLQVNYGYQGKEILAGEFYDGTGLDEYDFASRYYDPQLGRWHTPDPAAQFPSPYNGMGNNWFNGTDPNGAWFGIDDIIVAAVGFVYGYVSTGIKTGNWGWKAVGNGLLNAAMFELGYLTAGGGLAATAGASATSSVAMNAAGNFLASSAINMAVGQLFPSIPIQIGNFSFSISPVFGLDGAGISLNAGYSDGNFSIGFSYGFGESSGTNDLSGGFKSATAGSYTTIGGNIGFVAKSTYYGASYGYNKTGGKASQGIANIGLQFGDFGLRIDEDFLGDKGDRFRTGGGTATYRINDDVTLAFGLGMVTGEANGKLADGPGPNGTYDASRETPGAFRGGALYGGVIYKGFAYMAGINSERVLHGVQNWIHRNLVTTAYFQDLHYKTQLWSYFGNYNNYSLIY
jgi:RHS repeat-associated protein